MLDHNHTTAGLLEMKNMFHYTSRVQTNTQIRKFNTSGFLIRRLPYSFTFQNDILMTKRLLGILCHYYLLLSVQKI